MRKVTFFEAFVENYKQRKGNVLCKVNKEKDRKSIRARSGIVKITNRNSNTEGVSVGMARDSKKTVPKRGESGAIVEEVETEEK